MYTKSIGYEDRNYFDDITPEIFEKIVATLPYKPSLANLSRSSKEVQNLVFGTPCGKILSEIKALQPSYLRPYFSDNSFLWKGELLGLVMGAYFNYGTILSTFAGGGAGTIVGGAIALTVGGYVLSGFDGAKNGISAWASGYNPIPWAKLTLKSSLVYIDLLNCLIFKNKEASFQKIIEETPQQILNKNNDTYHRKICFFVNSNKEFTKNSEKSISEKQGQLSHPIARKGI